MTTTTTIFLGCDSIEINLVTLYYLANFLMAVDISNLATDWLFTVSKSLAQPVIGCLLSYSGWQNLQPSQNCLPKLNLAGNQDYQDTRIPYFF